MNIGNPDEFTVLELAKLVLEVTGSEVEIVFEPLPVDDPTRRRPDISLARRGSAGNRKSICAPGSSVSPPGIAGLSARLR